MNIPNSILTMLAGIGLTLVSIWYGQNHGLLPVQASHDAELVDGLFNTMMTVGTGIFLLVQGILIICLFKFRRRRGDDTDGPPIAGNIPLEILWTAIPVVIVLMISVYSFDVYRIEGGFDPEASDQPQIQVAQVAMLPNGSENGSESVGLIEAAPPVHRSAHHHMMALGVGSDQQTRPDLTVNVLGLQYAWIFTYADSGVTSGELHLPVNQDVKLVIKAQDVLHAFWLPQFRLKQDAIPGQDAELRFTPNRPGEYPIVCAELCGPYHGAMASKLYVHEPEEFDQWLQQQVAAQVNETQTVALKPASPAAAYLKPFAAEFAAQTGVDPDLLHQLHPAAAHSHSGLAAGKPAGKPAEPDLATRLDQISRAGAAGGDSAA